MRFQKISLISAAALTTIVSAGAYTKPAPHIPAPVGSDGHSFYVGGSISGLGGFVRNQSFTSDSASSASYQVTSTNNVLTTSNPSSFGYALSSVSADYTSTVNSLKFGGEAHLGTYFGVSEGFGLGLEVFGVTRTSFNPVSTITVTSGVSSTEITSLNAVTGTSEVQANADQISVGLNVQPQSIGYGVRLMPTVMLNDQFGMYASVGYGSQKWEGTLTNSAFFAMDNLYSSVVPTTSQYAPGTTNASGQSISKSLGGVNYGFGSVFNIDDVISVYTSLEVQTFSTYSVNAVGAVIASTTFDQANVTPVMAGTYKAGNTQIADAGSTATPSALTFQLNTYAIGIDYAFA